MLTRWFFFGWILVFPGFLCAQDAPVTVASNVFNAIPGNITVPVTVTGFTGIGAFSLDLQYDPSVMTFVQGIKNSTLYGSFMIGDNILPSGMHHLVISWFGSPKSLPDGSSLVDLKFSFIGGTTNLSWMDNGSSCEYADYAFNPLNDMPNICYYRNGIVTSSKCLDISLLLEGLYDSGSHTMISALGLAAGPCEDLTADKITVELHNAANYSLIEVALSNIDLSNEGLARVLVNPILNNSYYITIRHRNSVALTSASPVSLSGSVISYNFCDLASKAYGSNMMQMNDGKWAMFAGDTNQDGLVDSDDMIMVDNDASSFSSGYLPSDCTGDGLVDLSDMIIVDNHATAFVSALFPGQ